MEDPFGGGAESPPVFARNFSYDAPFFVFLSRADAEWPYSGDRIGDGDVEVALAKHGYYCATKANFSSASDATSPPTRQRHLVWPMEPRIFMTSASM